MNECLNFQECRTVAVSQPAVSVVRNELNARNAFYLHSITADRLKKSILRSTFDKYNESWQEETMFSSDTNEIVNNSYYKKIIGLGTDALVFILEDLKKNENHWFHALSSITNANPVKEAHRGIVPKMKNDWLDWAEKNSVY
jgi:hypothetical protein